MRDLGLLLKNYINLYIGGINKRSKGKSYIFGVLLIVVVGLIFSGMFVGLSVSTISAFIDLTKDPEVLLPIEEAKVLSLSNIISMTLIFVLMLVILRGTSNKKRNDYNLLMSLPLKKSSIILANILKDLILDFGILILTMMPGIIAYFVMYDNINFLVVIYGFIIVILLTLLANSLCVFLSSIILAITKNFKQGDIISTIISVVLTLIFIGFYVWYNSGITYDPNMAEKILQIYPVRFLVDIIYIEKLSNLLILLVIGVILISIAILIKIKMLNVSSKNYRKSDEKFVGKETSVFKSLLKNESGRYFRTNIYVLNTIIGPVLMLGFSAVIAIIGIEYVEGIFSVYLSNMHLGEENIKVLIVLLFVLMSSICNTTYCSISMEGKYFWILKCNPINPMEVFKSKIIFNFLIFGIPYVLGSLFMSLAIGIIYWPLLLVLGFLSFLIAAINGILIDLKYGKFDWQDETEIVKQGMSCLIFIATTVILPLVVIAFYFGTYTFISPELYLGIVSLVYIVAFAIDLKVLRSKGVQIFKGL